MQTRTARWGLFPAALLLAGLTAPSAARGATAKGDYIPDDVVKVKKKKKKKKKAPPKDGWFPSLKAGFSFAFSQNQGVVGITDGVTLALGLQLHGGLTYRHGGHEWVSKLTILHTQTKVPNLDPFIKAADLFELSSLYQYRFRRVKWLGVFGGLRLSTALLPGDLVRDADTNLAITRLDGAVDNDVATGQRPYQLTKSFAPLLFKQFAGGLAKPLDKPWLAIDIRLGLGAMEVWVRDGLVVDDNKDTADLLELKELQDFVQAGAELQLEMKGKAAKDVLSYGLAAEVMYPFAQNVKTDLTGAELINTEVRFTLGIKLFKWASLDYSLSVLRVPLIVDKWQVVNNLMLSITANIVK